MYFVAQYSARAENAGLRAAHQGAHIEYRKSFGERVLLSGPLLAADGDDTVGSLFIVTAESLSAATELAANDPLCVHGVYELVSVTPFAPRTVHPPRA